MAARRTPNSQWSWWLQFLDGQEHLVPLASMSPDHLTWRRGLYQAASRGGKAVSTRIEGDVMKIQPRRK